MKDVIKNVALSRYKPILSDFFSRNNTTQESFFGLLKAEANIKTCETFEDQSKKY